ncbi:MAG: glycoside hydrolase family 92 protein [Saprospiraceae bacterium]|nr:glycoside hydrolase family 92 protein [Saprospiraceae bacterium]
MKKYPFLLFTAICFWGCQKPDKVNSTTNLAAYVNPFIGTGAHGHTFPGATLPFGMVQLSPDTRLPGWDASSGYHFSDSTLYGFSHTHLSGTGIGDMGDILLLPFTGEVSDSLLATFSKSQETARAGYYQVYLNNFGVKAELTATLRTGMHRYTFLPNATPKLLIDLAHVLQANWGHQSLLGELELVDSVTIRGKRVSSGWAYDHPVYFVMQFSKPFNLIKATDRGKNLSSLYKSGKELKAYLQFKADLQNELIIKTGISPVSMSGAMLNLKAENPNWDFDAIQQEATGIWETELRKIEIQSSDEAVKENFYTALYHSMLAPMLAQDIDGKYRGMDKQIHQAADGYVNYTVFSLWDTFRALHPLMNMIDRKHSNEWVKTLLQKYREGGVLPKWELASNYTGTMVGYPSVAVIADALAKGIDEFDVQLALQAAVISSNYHPEITARLVEPRALEVLPKHLDFIEKIGFIPTDSISQSVSYGLECAYYDWCIAQIAERAGNTVIAEKYKKRSTFYQAYFDPKIGFMRGKLANGQWKIPFDPYHSELEGSEFVEGNAWQWMWFVPHDVEGYIALMGGKAAFAQKLDELFSADSEITGEVVPADISGLIGQYAHGNEPSHHVAHFYNYVDQPAKTQTRLDEVLYNLYTPTPEGISGNEDCGAMSAWYILNALGFYPVCPGSSTYSIGRPLVEAATIYLENGKVIHIKVNNNSRQNKLIERMELNGKPLIRPFFEHEAIADGGVLEFWMK